MAGSTKKKKKPPKEVDPWRPHCLGKRDDTAIAELGNTSVVGRSLRQGKHPKDDGPLGNFWLGPEIMRFLSPGIDLQDTTAVMISLFNNLPSSHPKRPFIAKVINDSQSGEYVVKCAVTEYKQRLGPCSDPKNYDPEFKKLRSDMARENRRVLRIVEDIPGKNSHLTVYFTATGNAVPEGAIPA